MDWIIQLLARLFSAFKLKNPVVAGVILLLVGAAVKTAQDGVLLGLFTLPAWANQVVQYVGLFLLAVTGSQTYQYLNPAPKK